MKFARFLQETLTPEWKEAYIDYRALKRLLRDIQNAQDDRADATNRPVSMGDLYVTIDVDAALEKQQRDDFKVTLEMPCLAPVKSSNASLSTLLHTPTEQRRMKLHSDIADAAKALSLGDLLSFMPSSYRGFLAAVDAQLEKVEKFYLAREAELQARSATIREQAQELDTHRDDWLAASSLARPPGRVRTWSVHKNMKQTAPTYVITLPTKPVKSQSSVKRRPYPDSDFSQRSSTLNSITEKGARDPNNYPNAKRKLKKVVFEHYRLLEMLNNYRILNHEGFRKVLKKFDKVTKSHVQDAYIQERVLSCSFTSETSIKAMLKEAEELFAANFTHFDKKEAIKRLRAGTFERHQYFSAFRSGIYLGTSLPALIAGIYCSCHTHLSIRDGLLFAYAVLATPLIFALLVGVNLMVWTHFRINYVFIFGLDVRTRLHRWEYFEIPSFLFACLCYAFWFSFWKPSGDIIKPEYYPLIWIALVIGVMINPLPWFARSSRYWFLKSAGRLLAPGWSPVEFTDFWLGDQLCSFAFTFSNFYTLGYAYAHDDFENIFTRRDNAGDWLIPFILLSLPLLVRVIQSVRRYADSGLKSHLTNAGKYGVAALAQLFYYQWRYQKTPRNALFAVWCVVGVASSLYSSIWDVAVDWSLLQPHAHYKLLRGEVIYTSHLPMYYFAIVTNVIIRFIWVIYIPQRGPSTAVRSIISGGLEMLRRFQWNFYRVENEHLGNKDQYRVSREVPLPYRNNEETPEEEEDDRDNQAGLRRGWIPVLYH